MRSAFVSVRFRAESQPPRSILRQLIASVDPKQPIDRVATTSELMAETIQERTFVALGIALVAGVAWLLATSGFLGVILWDIQQRRTEWHVRAAIGASRLQIVSSVIRRSLYPVCAGLAIGFPISFLISRVGLGAVNLPLLLWSGSGFIVASSIILGSAAVAAAVGGMVAVPDQRRRRNQRRGDWASATTFSKGGRYG